MGFILKNFATPIAFFIMFRLQGAKPAIALAVAVTLAQLLVHRVLRIGISPFFLVASSFTLLFGGLDLVLRTPQLYRLEPFCQNFLLGAVFVATAFRRVPIAEWFAEALPAPMRPRPDGGMRAYLRNVTLLWSAYFFLKAFLFLYLAFTVDLGRLVVLRSLIGGLSLAAMFGLELAYRKWILPRRGAGEGAGSSTLSSE